MGMHARSILIVEDHQELRSRMIDWLQDEIPGFLWYGVNSGEEAITLVKTQEFCVVLMDIRLPGIDGIVTTRVIKRMAPYTTVVMVTALYGGPYEQDALQAGASEYILKEKMSSRLVPALQKLVVETNRFWESRI